MNREITQTPKSIRMVIAWLFEEYDNDIVFLRGAVESKTQNGELHIKFEAIKNRQSTSVAHHCQPTTWPTMPSHYPHHCPGAASMAGNCNLVAGFCKTHQIYCQIHSNHYHLSNEPCPKCVAADEAQERERNAAAKQAQKVKTDRVAAAVANSAKTKGKNPTRDLLKKR